MNRAHLLLTLAVLFWAGNFILGRAFHAVIPPICLAFWRWFFASLLITFPSVPYLRRDWRVLCEHWVIVLSLSLLGVAAFNTLVYTGLQYTQAINAFLIQSLMPVMIVLMSFAIFREKISLLQSLGVTLSLCGALVIILRGNLEQLDALSVNEGDLFVVAAMLCYALYTVLLRKRPQVHALSLLTTTFWVGTITLLPFYIWELSIVGTASAMPSVFFVIGYVAVFPSIVSFFFYNRGVELVGPSQAGLFIHLMPVFGSLMAILFLGESFYWFHTFGIVMIAMGIYFSSKG